MKKLILFALLITAAIYQPAKAQVSLSINVGTRPYAQPIYYSDPQYVYVAQPRHVYRTHYVQPRRKVIVARPVYYSNHRVYETRRVYRNDYRNAPRYHKVKHHGNGHHKHFAKHKRGRH